VLLAPLDDAVSDIFAVSTFDTEHAPIKEAPRAQATAALRAHGHAVKMS
jgi:hypothetical protein